MIRGISHPQLPPLHRHARQALGNHCLREIAWSICVCQTQCATFYPCWRVVTFMIFARLLTGRKPLLENRRRLTVLEGRAGSVPFGSC